MGSLSIWHWILVILVVVLLFGRGKVSDLMGDVAKGIKSFKKGLAEDEPSHHHRRSQADRAADRGEVRSREGAELIRNAGAPLAGNAHVRFRVRL